MSPVRSVDKFSAGEVGTSVVILTEEAALRGDSRAGRQCVDGERESVTVAVCLSWPLTGAGDEQMDMTVKSDVCSAFPKISSSCAYADHALEKRYAPGQL